MLISRPHGNLAAADVLNYVLKDTRSREKMYEFIDLSTVENWSLSHPVVENIVKKMR